MTNDRSAPGPSISTARMAPGPLLFLSGQVAMLSDGSVAHPGDPDAQAEMVFEQIGAVLTQHGCGFGDVVKLTTYLTDPAHLDAFKHARSQALAGHPPPAATTVVVAGLARPDLLIEVDAVAALPAT